MSCIYVNVRGTQEEVCIALDQLPRDAGDVADILRAEEAPLHQWLTIAREYFKQGKIDQFIQLLEECSGDEIPEAYKNNKYGRIAILNALGAYATYVDKSDPKVRKDFISATGYYNKAAKIDQNEPITWAGKGQLLLVKGELEPAFNAFNIVLNQGGPVAESVPCLLGLASIHFNRGRFQESLNVYKKVLQIHPQCPAFVRLGLGYCRYRLGQFNKARQAFQRVLQLDPENVEALVALGIMDLNANDVESVQEGTKKMLEAYEIYPYCATALNHLANHFFYTEQHYYVEQLMEAALAATDHPLTKSQSLFNLARSYHHRGDFEKAGVFYRRSVQELKNPKDFILPYYGLGQVHMKLGDYKSALPNFEKVLEVHPESCETLKVVGYIHLQQGRSEKALENFRKATRYNPRDFDAWIEQGELLVQTDFSGALEAFKTAHSLLTKNGDAVPLGLLNNIGVLHFEREEFKLAETAFVEALGEGPWSDLSEGRVPNANEHVPVPAGFAEKEQLFQQLEEQGVSLEIPPEKVTVIFNLARLFEKLHEMEKANVLHQLIIFKHPDYVDSYLRLAAMAQARNNLSLSMDLVGRALKEDENNVDVLSFRGSLELKADDWLKAKDTLKGIQNISGGKDCYSNLALGNWNYFAATRSERKDSKLEATHLEKARELYQKVLTQKPNNMYAANGIGIVFSEKGSFDTAKDIFTQVQEAASGNVAVEMPDVWINLAHIYFAQGHFGLAVKMYQNCLRRFYFNTDTNILLYLARTHYEAEQWQECKRVLLHAIHLAPTNYMLRFDAAIAMQKFATATLQKTKRTADEVRQSLAELKNAVRLFSQLLQISSHHMHGFDEKKIDTHVEYCKHLLDAAKVHLEAAEREESQYRQKQEVARQVAAAAEAQKRVEEERRLQHEKKKRDEERKRVMEQELQFQRLKENWKYRTEEEGEKKKRRRKRKRKEEEEEPAPEEPDGEEAGAAAIAAAGLEDSDEEEVKEKPTTRLKRALSDSEDETGKPPKSPAAPIDEPESDGENDRIGGRRAKKTRISDSESE